MAYEHKPGSFTLFKNDKKENENQPDYKGSGMDLNGVEVWVSAWVKRPDGKQPFLSGVTQPKNPQTAPTPTTAGHTPTPATPEPAWDLPF